MGTTMQEHSSSFTSYCYLVLMGLHYTALWMESLCIFAMLNCHLFCIDGLLYRHKLLDKDCDTNYHAAMFSWKRHFQVQMDPSAVQ